MNRFTGTHRAAILAPYLKALPAFDREEHYLRWRFFNAPTAAALLLICNYPHGHAESFKAYPNP